MRCGAGKGGQHLRVNPIALLELADRTRKLAGPLRIDQRHRDAGVHQRGGDAAVITTGRLNADQSHAGRLEAIDKLNLLGVVVLQRKVLLRKIDEAVQGLLGNIDPGHRIRSGGTNNNRFIMHDEAYPSLRMRTAPNHRNVQPAVRVNATRPTTIPLRDDVHADERTGVRTRPICRRPVLRGRRRVVRRPRSTMRY
jgi:hypothetical protein